MNIEKYASYKIMIFMYDGTNLYGWKSAENLLFISNELENALFKVTKERIKLKCAARTDARVHALKNICNFHTNSSMNNEKMTRCLNYHLPSNIRVICIQTTHMFFSSRFYARARCYEYLIYISKIENPFLQNKALQIRNDQININKMIQAQQMLLNMKTIKGLCLKGFTGNMYRTMLDVNVTHRNMFGSDIICFYFEAKSFAHHQIRIIMHFLIQIGLNKMSLNTFEQIVAGIHDEHKILAKPHGLYLVNIKY